MSHFILGWWSMYRTGFLFIGFMVFVLGKGDASMVTNLVAKYQNGQVFLTWAEDDLKDGTTLNAYTSHQPITSENVAKATRIGHHIERHSAKDWWQDPASFFKDEPPGIPAGFVIAKGAKPRDPSSGLFVHTITETTQGPCYFAITTTDPNGIENHVLTPSKNSLKDPIVAQVAPVRPIYIGTETDLVQHAAKGKAFIFSLHGRGGGYTAGGEKPKDVNYQFFGNAKQGWREGLAFKFQVEITETAVRVMPCGRQWTGGRPLMESRDKRDHCPAINTWYYGYPERIYETLDYKNKVIPNYAEEQLLGIVQWAQDYLGTDPNQCYLTGGSMGGSGSVSLGFHYPNVFAHIDVNVPAIAYTPEGNLQRLNCFCGPLDNTVVNHKGEPFLEHMNSILTAQKTTANLPFLIMRSGRTDRSIPWANKPAFYVAMNTARQALVAYWSNGDHATADDDFPKESHYAPAREKLQFDRSYLAFSNCSKNNNPGNGDPKEGDLQGWINRGLDWENIIDTEIEYRVTVQAYYEELTYPVVVDVTPRRLQAFRFTSGDIITVQLSTGERHKIRVDDTGLLIIPKVQILNREGTHIHLTKN
jgi:dienelactone hydrolase